MTKAVLRHLITLIALIAFLSGAHADTTFTITATQSLTQIGPRIMASTHSGVHRIRFNTFAKPGQFKLDQPPAAIDTLILERNPKLESDSAIQVEDALLDIKRMPGTVVLRGLAFQLTNPNAVLLSGYEVGKPNRNLVIDSCFIFGDNNASAFLSWLGAQGSRIEIYRSYLVFREGTGVQSRVLIQSSNVLIANSLLNFQGHVNATLLDGGKFECQSNTINRTQFRLTPEVFQRSTYAFVQNAINHRPRQDALGGATPYVLHATGFEASLSVVQANRMFTGWVFDHPINDSKLWNPALNQVKDTLGAKPSTEMWNWYASDADSVYGYLAGLHKRKERYNVWPGETQKPFTFELNPATVTFKTAPFPRQFQPIRVPSVPAPMALSPKLRFHTPALGALRFGPFQVENIALSTYARLGRPRLLAADSSLQFQPQRITGAYDAPTFPFPNDLTEARWYYLAFEGNTPRGDKVSPDASTSGLTADDSLVYAQVDSAGYTLVTNVAMGIEKYPPDLRPLLRNLNVTSSAWLSGNMVIGAKAASAASPFWPEEVHWWRPSDGQLIRATKSSSEKFHATLSAAQTFSMYMVEKLTVRRGTTTIIPLKAGGEGEVRVTSVGGFQLRVDSNHFMNPLRFGDATPAYQLQSTGRGENELVSLRLRAGQDREAFRVVGNSHDSATALRIVPDSSGLLEIPVTKSDSNARFFTAVAYNVIAGIPFQKRMEGVDISGLVSKTSGLIRILPFDSSLLRHGEKLPDTLPANARKLGAKGLFTRNLDLEGRQYEARFLIDPPTDRKQVESFAWDGMRWRTLPASGFRLPDTVNYVVSGLGANDAAILVMERLKSPDQYVDTVLVLDKRKITVRSQYSDTSYKPIKSLKFTIQYVDGFGDIRTATEGPWTVGTVAEIDLTKYPGYVKFGVQYFTNEAGTESYGSMRLQSYPTHNWNFQKLSLDPLEEAENRFHLFGYPYRTIFGRNILKVRDEAETAIRAKTAWRIRNSDTGSVWDSVPNLDVHPLEPGDALLFSSTARYLHVVDTNAQILPGSEHALSPGVVGWKLVSVPFPRTFSRSLVGSSLGSPGPFKQLDTVPAPLPKIRGYAWNDAEKLLPFRGYAYYFRPGESLFFDPWKPMTQSSLARASALNRVEPSVEVAFRSGALTRSMSLRSGPTAFDIPYLPVPGGGIDMRVGGKAGFLWKKVESLNRIEEPLSLRSLEAGLGRLDLSRPADAGEDWQARLLELSSGRVLDPYADPIAVPAGGAEYRLVAGNRAFVEERVDAFRAGIPAGLLLAQNHPNPFRLTTRVAVEWPTLETGSASRQAVLEIFDTRGRRVDRHDLGPVRAGRQLITVDASRWEPGLYTYRLTVATGNSRVRLQKRMLVSP